MMDPVPESVHVQVAAARQERQPVVCARQCHSAERRLIYWFPASFLYWKEQRIVRPVAWFATSRYTVWMDGYNGFTIALPTDTIMPIASAAEY